MVRTIRMPQPFAAPELAGWLRLHLVAGLEAMDGRVYRRVMTGGTVVKIDIGDDAVRVSAPEARDSAAAVTACRRMVDADADPAAVDGALSMDPALAPAVRRHPGLRLPGTADGFELLIRTVLAQQVSLAAAHTMTARVVAAYGKPLDTPAHGLVAGFPVADVLADATYDGIGLTGGKIRTLRAAATAYAEGALDLSPAADQAATRAALLALPGIGPWTVEYVAMRALGDRDAYPGTDLVLRRVATAADAEAWRPYRAYAAMHLWVGHLTTVGALP